MENVIFHFELYKRNVEREYYGGRDSWGYFWTSTNLSTMVYYNISSSCSSFDERKN